MKSDKPIKVLAINGSPRADGNTSHMLQTILDICKKADLETELYQAGGKQVRGCIGCGKCGEHKGKCEFDDWINELYPKMASADAIILGSPTYFADVSTEMKAIIDRCGFIALRDDRSLSRKVGAAVTAVRRAGGTHTLDSMQHFLTINDMIIPGSTYWGMSLSRAKGEYEQDSEGIAIMTRLGENIVWLLNKIVE